MQTPIPKGLTTLFREFFNVEKTSGFILIACAIFSLFMANSSAFGEGYQNFWHISFFGHTLQHWINDGLMAIFFLLVGLEIERELYIGELHEIKHAMLPLFAAVGGMLFPAFIHLYLNWGTFTQSGAGIPMATDIAFALGVLSIVDKRVPVSLKIFLTSFAIIDDIGAVIVIAIFYTKKIVFEYLGLAFLLLALLFVINRCRCRSIYIYALFGAAIWYFMSQSGIHAALTGILLAFTVPFINGDSISPSHRLQHHLHKPVAFIIMPLFALANTGIVIPSDFYAILTTNNSLGIMLGLFLGKPLGIMLMSFIAVKMKWGILPEHTSWRHLLGAGFLGGIGFTMSIFITFLAFDSETLIVNSKIAILFISCAAGVVGLLCLAGASAPNQKF